ncbi:MAG: HEAT repeat domain-containing protein [Anaerolineales bacterium]
MSRFLPKIYLEYQSFWAGVLLAVILLVLFLRFRSQLKAYFFRTINRIGAFRDKLSIASETDYSRILYKFIQGKHIASALGPLEKLSIPPRCIAPPPSAITLADTFDPSLLQQTLGYDPAFPEFAVEYSTPTFSLLSALSKGANICLLGAPGTGKTVAVADCITSLLKGKHNHPELSGKIPFYVEANHILNQFPGSDILEILLSAIQSYPPFSTIPNLPKYITTSLNQEQAILFIDSLDILSHTDINRVANYIVALTTKIPSLQIVIAASPSYFGNLVKAPLEFISIASWGRKEKYAFLEKWSQLWPSSISPASIESSADTVDQINIRNGLLVISDQYLTPLEFTLKAWAAYAGDLKGPSAVNSITSFLKRIISPFPQSSLRTLEYLALHSLEQQKSIFTKRDINSWLSNLSESSPPDKTDDKTSPINRAIQLALMHNLLQRIGTDGFCFTYPSITGFLASRAISRTSGSVIQHILTQPDWPLLYETMRYFSAFNSIAPVMEHTLIDSSLLKNRLLSACRWLSYLKKPTTALEETLLQAITREIHSNPIYLIKLRLTILLATSGNPSVGPIFRHLLQSQNLNTRRAAALGSGFIQDLNAVPLLIKQLNDQFPASVAACYALGKIGTPKALEAIAECLLHGDELLRRAAAESLAHNRSEGHPALREGATREDLLVRYAVVHGLSLIRESWATDILNKMRIDEDEWVVRDLAQQVFEILQTGSPYLPTPQPPAHAAAWLRTFSTQHDLVMLTPESALELLLNALENGSAEQKQAALIPLRQENYLEVVPSLLKALEDSNPDVHHQAALTLWYCTPPGYKTTSTASAVS